MINIQNTKTFRYDEDRSTVTVYGDYDDPNKWYIEPSVSFARQTVDGTSLPSFNLTEYNTNEGIQGTCNFTTELTVSPEALQAVYANLGHGITIGQFDWVEAQAYFVFQVSGEEYTINAVPSRYSTNRAAFVLHLPNQEWVTTFKTAFGPGQGSVSPFRIKYNALALSKLPAVDVTVRYNSKIAFDYEKEININRNVWGKETSRRETIKENLQNSDAGETIINWTTPPSPEMAQRVTDWAWVTLEGLVQKAVDDAVRFVGEKNADKINMSATSTFERKYSENQVIEWAIIPFAQLPAFNEQEWQRLYSKAENRNLAVAFTVRDNLKDNNIQYVEVTVKYPTKLTGNTFIFGQTGPTSWDYQADGTNPFDPSYEYRYKVQFAEAGNSYESPWIPSSDSTVVLPLTALGIQKAVFIGSNINFDEVDFVLIDFFFNLPNGVNKHEQKKMVDNVTPIEIASRSFLPSTNEYSYQLTYVMKDKRVVQVASRKVFPPQNSDLVTIFSPFQESIFTVGVINQELPGAPRITRVQLKAVYEDPQNANSQSHQWGFPVPAEEFYMESPPWTVDVISNPAGAFIQYDGTLILSNGKIRPLSKIRNQTGFINLSSIETPFTVEIDPFQIDWAGGVTMVQVDLFTLEGNPLSSEAISKALAENRTYIESQAFMKQTEGGVPKQYYTFYAPVGQPVVYYYQVTYFHVDGPDTYVDKTESQTQIVVLPKDGTASTPQVMRVELAPAAEDCESTEEAVVA